MFWLKQLYVLGLLSDARGIYGGNFDRLRCLKSKFDPDNVFNKSHAIVPEACDYADRA